MNTFGQQTRWHSVGADTWKATVDASWAQGRATFGGIVSAGALEAMRPLVALDRLPRSLRTTFVRPVAPGEAVLTTEVLRAGRALTTVAGRVHQGDRLCATIEASFGADRPSALIVEPAVHEQTRPAEDSVAMPYVPGITPAFTQHFDYRWESGHMPFSGGREAICSGWCRHRTPVASVHGALVGLLDAWPAPVLTLATRPVPASTVSWTASFLEVPPAFDPDGWWRFRSTPVQSANGYATTRGVLYAPDGRLAAHMEQLVAVFDA